MGRARNRDVDFWDGDPEFTPLFLMTLPDLRIYQLTDTPYVSFHPRFSPEGERIVFARSQRPWVSERDQIPWDVYILNFSGGRKGWRPKTGIFPFGFPMENGSSSCEKTR